MFEQTKKHYSLGYNARDFIKGFADSAKRRKLIDLVRDLVSRISFDLTISFMNSVQILELVYLIYFCWVNS